MWTGSDPSSVIFRRAEAENLETAAVVRMGLVQCMNPVQPPCSRISSWPGLR